MRQNWQSMARVCMRLYTHHHGNCMIGVNKRGAAFGTTTAYTDSSQNDSTRVKHRNENAAYDVRPPVPPFTKWSAMKKVATAEALWNSRNPELIALAYTKDATWRNRTDVRDNFFIGCLLPHPFEKVR